MSGKPTPNFRSNTNFQYHQEIPQINFDCSNGKPMQLVRINHNRKFEIVKETADMLLEFEEGIAICCIVGKYRTGKSFLMNKLLDLDKEGFKVSSSVNACTKGLWIWSKPIYNEKGNYNIFFMDSEGLDSIDRDGDLDSKVFALSVLLSSYFILNSMGAIDEASINSLALITNLIKTVCVDDDIQLESAYQLSHYAPKFLWVLRDFVLDIRDLKGNAVSPAMYLESALSDLPVDGEGYTRNAEKSTKIRQSILNFFKHRDCVTMVRPVHNEDQLRNISHLPDKNIREEFIDELYVIRDKIYKNCQQKVINGTGITSNMLITYLKQFIKSFNDGRTPVIKNAWENLLENDCENHYKAAVALYENDSSSFDGKNEEPLKILEHYRYLNQLRDYVMNEYMKCSYVEERYPEAYQRYKGRLKDYIDEKEKTSIEKNITYANSLNSEYINTLYFNFFRNNDFEGVKPDKLVKKIDEQILTKFSNNNKGGHNLRTFVESSYAQNMNLFNDYFNAINNVRNRKKKKANRMNEAEWELFKQEEMGLTEDKKKLNNINTEINLLEDQIDSMKKSNVGSDYNKLIDKNEALKKEMANRKKENENRAKELRNVNRELDRVRKGKSGCC